MRRDVKQSIRAAVLAAIAVGGSGVTEAKAEDVYVQRPSVVVREGKGGAYPEVATVTQGQKITIVAREGKWLRVKVGEKEGYLFENSVTARKVTAGAGDALGANAEASRTSAGAAAKGLGPEAEAYANSKNLDRRPLEKMIAFNKSIGADEWEKFTADGKVGPAKQ